MATGRKPYVEATAWLPYHTYLVVFLTLGSFFNAFILIFSGLILTQVVSSFSQNFNDILIIFSIISIGGVFTIIPNYLTDRYGRKPLVVLINLLFYSSIIGSAFAPSSLLFIFFQIIAAIFGIDLYAVWISEELPARYREKTIGIVAGFSMFSALLAGFLFIYTSLSEDMWRYLYSGVALFAIIILTGLWFRIKETRSFLSCKQEGDQHQEMVEETSTNTPESNTKRSLFAIFQRKYMKILILGTTLIFLTDWIYMTIKRYYVVFLLAERPDLGLTEETLGLWTVFVYIGSILGYYFSGYFSHRVGSNKKTIYFSVLLYFVGSIMFLFTYSNAFIIFMGLFIVNFAYAFFRLISEVQAQVFFPTKLRATGNGWVMLFATLVGIGSNFAMYFLLDILGGWANMFFAVGTVCLFALVLVTRLVPETNGRSVEELYLTEIENHQQPQPSVVLPTPIEYTVISRNHGEPEPHLLSEEIYATA
jgi:SP family arabinose:H+ symporter-like MFS transporter